MSNLNVSAAFQIMSPYARLAALRVGSPLPDLKGVLARGGGSPVDGWLSITSITVRADRYGNVGSLQFHNGFPSNVEIGGLHIGMTMDALFSRHNGGFRESARRYPFKSTPYVSDTDGQIATVYVSEDGSVFRFELDSKDAAYSGSPYSNGPIWPINLRSYTNDAEILADWAGCARADAYSFNHAEAHWLQHDSTPEDWHRYVADYNWGQGIAPLLWIVRQPRCEKATALLAFFMSRPGGCLDYVSNPDKVPGWQNDAYDLMIEIRDRFLGGAYSSATIAFDAEAALLHDAYLPENPDQAAFDHMIPHPMRLNVQGRAIDMNTAPAIPVRPERFQPHVSTLRPPPLTDSERLELASRSGRTKN